MLIRKSFEFGPGTPQARSHFRTFSVPARSRVGVAVDDMSISAPTPGGIPVVIEVRAATATSIGSSGPDGPLLATRFANADNSGVIAFANQSFTSDFGCPSSWRVRVRSTQQAVPARVSGTIVFDADPPDPVRLEMTGADTQNLDTNVTAARILRGRDAAGNATGFIGTGSFRIKAKWHTDPADVLNFGAFRPLTVALLRPDGTVAASETGLSSHANVPTGQKVDFSYQSTSQDSTLTGAWELRITNNSSSRIVDFDIDRGSDPNPALSNFSSTFTGRCE
jgi:hypothetical protein